MPVFGSCDGRAPPSDEEDDEPEPPLANEADCFPSVLRVLSPHAHEACNGEYMIFPCRKNDFPVWAKRDGDKKWLFSGADGRWHIGGPESMQVSSHAHSKSFISCKAPHKGRSPADFAKSWQRRGPLGLQDDRRITVEEVALRSKGDSDSSIQSDSTRASGASTARSVDSRLSDTVAQPMAWSTKKMLKPLWGRRMDPPEARHLPLTELQATLRVSIREGQTVCNGLYQVLPGERRNGQPVWSKREGGSALWLFCSPEGVWCIAGRDAKEKGFVKTCGYIAQTDKTPGVFPPDCTTAWRQWTGDAFVVDDSIAITYAAPCSRPEADGPRPRRAESL